MSFYMRPFFFAANQKVAINGPSYVHYDHVDACTHTHAIVMRGPSYAGRRSLERPAPFNTAREYHGDEAPFSTSRFTACIIIDVIML